MPEGTHQVRIPAGPRKRLLADEMSPASVFVDVVNTPWATTKFPGIQMKLLFSDGAGFETLLLKIEPGAEVPLHEHMAVEQSYVLEGTFEDDEGVTTTGNFVWRPAGSAHVAWAGPGGATLLAVFRAPNHFDSGQILTQE